MLASAIAIALLGFGCVILAIIAWLIWRSRAQALKQKAGQEAGKDMKNLIYQSAYTTGPSASATARSTKNIVDCKEMAFVVTDIEGSTQLSVAGRAVYDQLLAIHDQLMREGIAKFNGTQIVTEGDSFLVAFPSAAEAVAFCLDLQFKLLDTPWPRAVLRLPGCQPVTNAEGDVIMQGPRVRMGVHWALPGLVACRPHALTKAPMIVGIAVSIAQEISDAAHGGQILISQDAWGKLRGQMSRAGFPIVRRLGLFQLAAEEGKPCWLYTVDGSLLRPVRREMPPPRKLVQLWPPPGAAMARDWGLYVTEPPVPLPGRSEDLTFVSLRMRLPRRKRGRRRRYSNTSRGLSVHHHQVPTDVLLVLQQLFVQLAQQFEGYMFGSDVLTERRGYFTLAFASPANALRFCHTVQVCLMYHRWPDATAEYSGQTVIGIDGRLVFKGPRMAASIHCGSNYDITPMASCHPTAAADAEYRGPAVAMSRALADAAHGGQVLLTEEAWQGVQDLMQAFPSAMYTINLGLHIVADDFRRPRYLYEVMPTLLSGRSFRPPNTLQQLELGYREAPNVHEPMTIVFVKVAKPVDVSRAEANVGDLREEQVLEAITAFQIAVGLYSALARSLLPAYGGYECKEPEPGKFTMAFGCLNDAIAWACHVQKGLLQIAWPPALLEMGGCEEQLGLRGQRIWRGLRVRVGMAYGYINVKKPMNTGRADYFGELANTAARVAALAAPGQILVESSQVALTMPDGSPLLREDCPTHLLAKWASLSEPCSPANHGSKGSTDESLADNYGGGGVGGGSSGGAGGSLAFGSIFPMAATGSPRHTGRVRRGSYSTPQAGLGRSVGVAVPFQRNSRASCLHSGESPSGTLPNNPLTVLRSPTSKRRLSLLEVTSRSLSLGAQHLLSMGRKPRTCSGGVLEGLPGGRAPQVFPSQYHVETIELRALGKFLLRGLDNPKILYQALPETLAERTYPIAKEALVSMQNAAVMTPRGDLSTRGGLLGLLRRTAGQFGGRISSGATRGSYGTRVDGRRKRRVRDTVTDHVVASSRGGSTDDGLGLHRGALRHASDLPAYLGGRIPSLLVRAARHYSTIILPTSSTRFRANKTRGGLGRGTGTSCVGSTSETPHAVDQSPVCISPEEHTPIGTYRRLRTVRARLSSRLSPNRMRRSSTSPRRDDEPISPQPSILLRSADGVFPHQEPTSQYSRRSYGYCGEFLPDGEQQYGPVGDVLSSPEQRRQPDLVGQQIPVRQEEQQLELQLSPVHVGRAPEDISVADLPVVRAVSPSAMMGALKDPCPSRVGGHYTQAASKSFLLSMGAQEIPMQILPDAGSDVGAPGLCFPRSSAVQPPMSGMRISDITAPVDFDTTTYELGTFGGPLTGAEEGGGDDGEEGGGRTASPERGDLSFRPALAPDSACNGLATTVVKVPVVTPLAPAVTGRADVRRAGGNGGGPDAPGCNGSGGDGGTYGGAAAAAEATAPMAPAATGSTSEAECDKLLGLGGWVDGSAFCNQPEDLLSDDVSFSGALTILPPPASYNAVVAPAAAIALNHRGDVSADGEISAISDFGEPGAASPVVMATAASNDKGHAAGRPSTGSRSTTSSWKVAIPGNTSVLMSPPQLPRASSPKRERLRSPSLLDSGSFAAACGAGVGGFRAVSETLGLQQQQRPSLNLHVPLPPHQVRETLQQRSGGANACDGGNDTPQLVAVPGATARPQEMPSHRQRSCGPASCNSASGRAGDAAPPPRSELEPAVAVTNNPLGPSAALRLQPSTSPSDLNFSLPQSASAADSASSPRSSTISRPARLKAASASGLKDLLLGSLVTWTQRSLFRDRRQALRADAGHISDEAITGCTSDTKSPAQAPSDAATVAPSAGIPPPGDRSQLFGGRHSGALSELRVRAVMQAAANVNPAMVAAGIGAVSDFGSHMSAGSWQYPGDVVLRDGSVIRSSTIDLSDGSSMQVYSHVRHGAHPPAPAAAAAALSTSAVPSTTSVNSLSRVSRVWQRLRLAGTHRHPPQGCISGDGGSVGSGIASGGGNDGTPSEPLSPGTGRASQCASSVLLPPQRPVIQHTNMIQPPPEPQAGARMGLPPVMASPTPQAPTAAVAGSGSGGGAAATTSAIVASGAGPWRLYRAGSTERSGTGILRGGRTPKSAASGGTTAAGGIGADATSGMVYSPRGRACSPIKADNSPGRRSFSSSASSMYSGTASPHVATGAVDGSQGAGPQFGQTVSTLIANVFGRGRQGHHHHTQQRSHPRHAPSYGFRRRSAHIVLSKAARLEVVQRSIATAEPCPDAIAADPAGREPQTFAAAVARTYVEHRRQQQQPLPIIRPGAMESWDEGTLPVSSLHRSSLGNVTGSVHDESISQILGATALLNTSAGASTAAAAAAALNWMAMDRQSGASGTGPGPATAAAVAHHHHLSPAAPHAVGSLLSDIGAPRLGRASLGLGIANSCLANSGQIPSGCLSTTRGTLAATSNPGPGERFGNTVAAPAVLGLEQGSVEIHSVDELGPVEFGLPLSALPPVQLQSPQVPLLFTEYAPAGGSISSMCEGQSPPRPLSPSLPPPSPQQQQPQHLHPQHHQQHRPLLLRNTSWESAMLAHQQQQDQQQRLPHGSAQSAQFGRDFGAWKPLPAAPGAATQVAGSAMPATAMPAMVPSVQICGGGNSAAAVMAMNNFNVNTASVAVQGYATGTHSIAQTSPPSSERLIPVAAPSQTAAQLDQQQQQQQDQLSPVNPRVEDIGADGGEASALAPLLRPLSYQLAFGATALGVSGGSDAVSSPVGRPYVWVAAPGMAATAAAGDVGITHSAAANASASLFVPASMPCAPSAARAGRVSAPSGLGISDMEMVPEITVPPRATDHIRRSIECRIDSAARTRAATAASLVPGAVAADGTGQVVYLRPLNFGGTPQRGGGLGGGGSSGRRSHSGSYHTKTGHGRRMMMMAVGSGDGCQQRGPRVIEAALPGPSHPLYYNTPMAEWDEPEAIAAMTAAAQAITPAGGTATRRSAFSLRSAKRLSAGQQQQQLLSQLATSPALPARAQATADAPPGEATAAAAVTAGSSALGLMPGGPTIARSSRSSLPGLGRFPFISGALWSQSQPASALVPSCAPLSPPLPQSLQLQPQPQPQPEQRLCPMPHHHPPYTIRPLHDVQGGQQQLQQQQQPPRQRGLHQLQPHALDPGRQQVAGLTRVSWHNLFPSPLAGGGGSGGDGGGGTVFAAERPAGSTSTDGFNPSGELTKRSQPQQEQFSPLSQSSIQNQSSRSRTLPMLSPGSSPREVAAPTPSGSNNADSGGDISGAGGAIPSAVPSWTLPSGGSTLVLGSQASDATSRRSASPVTPPRLTPSLSTPPPASAEASMMASCMRPHSLGAFTNVRGTLEVERTGWRVSRHTPPLPPAATMRVLEVPELDEARGPRAGTTQGTDAGEPPSLNAILRRTKRELMAQLGQCKSAEEANRITRILMAIVPDQRVGPGASQTADIGREPPPKPPTMSMPTSTPMLMPMRAPFPTLTAIWNPLNSIWDERGEQTAERSAWAPFSVAQPSLPALQQLSRFPQSQQPKKAPKETAQQQRSQSLLSTDPASLGARMQLLRPPELQLTASGSLAGSAAAALSAPPTVTATVPTPASNDERAFLNSTRERSLANSGGTALPTAFCARNPRDSGPREIAFRALMGSVHRAADVGMEAAEGQGLRDATLSAGERAASTAEPQPTAGPSGKRRDSSTSRDEDDVLNFPTHVDNLGMKAPAATARQEHYLVGLEQTQSQEERSTLCPSGPSLGPIRTSSSLPRHTSVNADSSSRSNSDRGSGDEGGGVRSYGGASGGSASRRSCGNSETPHLTFTPRSPVGSEHSGRSGHRRAPSGLETADLDGAGDTAEGAAFGSLLPSFDVASSGCGGLQIFTSPRTGLITGAGSRAVTPGAAAATTAAAVTIGSSSGGASSLGGGFASAAAAALAQHIFVSSSSVAHSRTFSRAIGSRSGASRAGSVIAVSLGDGLASSPTSSRLAGLEAIESGSHTLSQVVAAAALAGRAAGEFNSESDRGLLLSYRRLTASTGELETLSTEGIGDSSRALPVPLSWRHVTARRLRRSSSIAATSLNSGGGPLGSSIRRAGLRVEPTVSCGGEPEAVEAGADSEVGAGSASGLNIDRAATRAMAIDSGNRAELAAGSAAGLPAAAGGSCGFPSKAPSVWCLQASRAAVAGAAGDAGNSSACSRALPHSASFDGTDTDAGVNAACTDFADEDEGDGGVTDRPSQTAVSYTERTSTFSMQSLQCMTERTSPTMCGGGGGGGDGGGAPERFSNPSSFSNMSTRTDLLETEAQGWRQRRKAAGSSSSSVAASSYSRTSATTSISASHGRTSTTSGMRRTWGTTSRASTELFMPPGDLDDGGSGGGGDGDGPGGCVWGGDDGDGVGVGGVSVLQSTRRRHSLNTGSVPREPWAPPVAFVGDGDGDGDDDNNVASSGVEMLVRGLSGAVQSSAAPAVGLPPPPSPLLLPVVRGRRSGVVMTVVAEADLEVDSPRGCDMGGVGEGG